MADLKVGTTVGGSPVWHQGNLALVPSGNAILYKGARIYSENDKPSANELQVVSRAGDTMTGVLNVETSTEYPLALKSSVSGPAYIRFSKGNTLQSYIGTDAAGDFKVAMTDVNGSWAFDGLKIAKSNGDVSLRGALVSTNAGNFDIKYGNVQFIRANSSKHLYIGAPGGTDLILGYAQDGMTTAKIRIDSAVYNKTGGLLISSTGLIQRSAMDNPYYNQTESDARFIRLNVNTATNGYLLSKPSNAGTTDNLSMGYSGFFRHNSLGGFRGLTINVSHPDQSNGAHARGITFDYGGIGNGYAMYTYAYDSAGNKLANQKIYTEADKPTPAEIGALAAGANAVSASKLQTARTISLTGGATGSVSFDGSANASLAVTITNNSHTHSDYVKKTGDTMSGNLTVPRVLLSAAQGTEANSVARRDFVESTVTAAGTGVKDLTIALPAGAPATGYIPVLFKTYGTSNSFVFIDTLSSTSTHPMNNCSFTGNVRAGGWGDGRSYAVGQFTIHDGSERAIHSIHAPAEAQDGFVVYVETRAFPITVRVDVGTTVTAYATDATYGTSVFKVNGQVSGNTKTIVLANFDKGSGTYNGNNRVYNTGYNPTPEAVGALPVNGNAVTASRLQTARLIAGVSFDGTSNISISATNVGALPITGGTLTGVLNVPRLEISGTAAGISYGSNKNIIRSGTGAAIVIGNFTDTTYIDSLNGDVKIRAAGSTEYKVYHEGNKPTAADVYAPIKMQFAGDLNTIRTAGHYRLNPGFTNGPSGSYQYAQMLHVNGGGDTHLQILGSYSSQHLFWRGFNNTFGQGGNWNKIYHEGSKPTPAELGVVARNNVGGPLKTSLLDTPSEVYAYNASLGEAGWPWVNSSGAILSMGWSRNDGSKGGAELALNIAGRGLAYRAQSTASELSEWKQIYHEGFKPTPAAVGAVAKTGDTMTGALTVSQASAQPGLIIERTNLSYNVSMLFKSATLSNYLGMDRNGRLRYGSAVDVDSTGSFVYTSDNKPTPVDIGALPITGGTLTGSLVVNANINASGLFSSASITANTTTTYSGLRLSSNGAGYSEIVPRRAGEADFVWSNGIRYYNNGSYWAIGVNKIYHEAFKPTATDVGALPITGGTLTGNLTAPAVLVSSAQNTSANALTRKDYVDTEVRSKMGNAGDQVLAGNLTISSIAPMITLQETDTTKRFLLVADGYEARFQSDNTNGTIAWVVNSNGVITLNSPHTSADQGTSSSSLTRKDYVDGRIATRAPTTHNHTAAQANSNIISGEQYAVGSYILAQKLTASANGYGDNVLGSSLIPASAGNRYWDGHPLPGTWKLLGYAGDTGMEVDQRTSLFIRIS